ncbi:MAG TPA: 30S ribosomal protein S18 [Elusimicrobia bacterium]|nr:30S ribosomal protein S18 [Elusimicrobiota bacterium]HCE97240.1 30S ribosomal protein S18 [Elusimicrobiota bacterium]
MDNREQNIPRPAANPGGNAGATGPSGAGLPPHSAGPSHGPSANRRPPNRRHFAPRRKVCRLCAEHIAHIDFKQGQIVKSFCSESGKILSRRITGACAKHQRQIMRAVKINRNLSLMSYDG